MERGLQSNSEFRKKLDDITSKKEEWGILVIGIDGFKRINNLYSYSFGDKVLETLFVKVIKELPEDVLLYRMDGDCFGLLQRGADRDKLESLYDKLKEIAGYCIVDDMCISLTISGGMCFYPEDGPDGETLYKNARIALIASKDNGGCCCTKLSTELLSKVQFHMNLVEAVKESVQNGCEGFELYYQPIILAETGELYGCEALLRFKHKLFKQGVMPNEFIPVLENYGMIIEVGNWVLETGLKQLAEWTQTMPDFQMSINVSSVQFENPGFKQDVIKLLKKYEINPGLVTLELTESGMITNIKYVAEVFDFLRSQGIKIALDDFGTGYASLEIFRDLSADELKIDRSFLNRISYDITDQKIISQLIQLCDSMNMFVCVEGIETKEIEHVVKQLGPKLFQGYYYSEPFDADKFYNLYFKGRSALPVSEIAQERGDQRKSLYAAGKAAKAMIMDQVIDYAYAGIFQVGMDENFTFLACNEGYRRMLGYTAAEIDQRFKNYALSFVHPDDIEDLKEDIKAQLAQGDTIHTEFRIVRSDGTAIWTVGTGNLVKGKQGNVSLVVVIIDNDKAKKESLRIAGENALNQEILSRIPTGIKYIHYDEGFTIDYISEGFLSITGYSRSEISVLFDNKFMNMIYEEDRERVINDVLLYDKEGDILMLRYRMKCKDGSLIWLETVSCLYPADPDGIQRCCSSVVNVTQTITEEDKIHAPSLLARYQKAAVLWGEIFFEYNFQNHKITCSENFIATFGREIGYTMEEEILMIHKDDRKVLLKMLEDLFRQTEDVCRSTELRIRNGEGEFIWCSVVFNQPDRIGNIPVSVIGKVSKIDDNIKHQKEMLIRIQLDALTGLLNKGTLESRAREMMSSGDTNAKYALFLVDVDDFKGINAAYGHMVGDEVLQILAQRLQSTFKAKDLIGRTGGDEFLVFAEYIEDSTFVEARCSKIMVTLEEPVKIGDRLIRINVCLGVVFAREETAFYDLYQQANVALYRAKENGKGNYSIV